MSYVAKQLDAGERIVFMTSLHWIVFAGPVFSLLAGFGFVVRSPDMAGLGWLLILLGLVWLPSVIIAAKTTEFAVTTERVIVKVGLIRWRTLELMLTKVESIDVHQGILGRVFDFGTLQVSGSGSSKQPFKNIAQPMELRRQVQKGSSSSHSRAAQGHLSALAGGVGGDPAGQLERLVKLRDDGVLTAEEFEAQKRKVLDL